MIRSRSGLTRCPSCRAHVRAADAPSETACPFCGSGPAHDRPDTAPGAGRSAVLAAALFALSACGGPAAEPAPEERPTAGSEQPASDDEPRAENENRPRTPEPAPEPPPVAAYGIAPEPQPQPLYGIAP